MRRLALLAALTAVACSGPAGPPPTSRPETRPDPPRTAPPPRTRPPARKAVRPRPKRWRAERLGQVPVTSAKGAILDVVAGGVSLVTTTRIGNRIQVHGWQVRRRKPFFIQGLRQRWAPVGLSADGKHLVLTTAAGTNLVLRLGASGGKLWRTWKRKRGRRKGRTQGLSAQGRMLIRGDVRGSVRGYELLSYKMKWLVRGERVVMSTDGKLALVVRGKIARTYDAVTGTPRGKPTRFSGPPRALAVHAPGRVAAVVPTGSPLKCTVVGLGDPRPVSCIGVLSLRWSPGGKRLALAGQGAVEIVRLRDGKTLARHKSAAVAPMKVAFLTDDRYVVANETLGQLAFYRLVRR